MELVKSINYSQSQIIKDILTLYVPGGTIGVDATFSKGVFYKDTNIPLPAYCFDLYPQADFVVKADSRHLPLEDSSIACEMFDSPFLATKGKSLELDNGSNLINKRFGVYPTETELHQFYIDSMLESYRILKDDGILIFKCQDKVSNGKQYLSHMFIINEAIKIGFYPKDLFILLAKSRIVANWQLKNQKHARKFHSYFIVLQKCNRKIKYI